MGSNRIIFIAEVPRDHLALSTPASNSRSRHSSRKRAFEQIGRLEVLVMRGRQPVIGKGFLDVGFHPGAEFGMLVLPAVEPGMQIGPRLGGVAPIVQPAQFLQACSVSGTWQMIERVA